MWFFFALGVAELVLGFVEVFQGAHGTAAFATSVGCFAHARISLLRRKR